MEQHADALAVPYQAILTLLPQLTIDELARLALEINQRIQRHPGGHVARLRAAVDSLSWEEDEPEQS